LQVIQKCVNSHDRAGILAACLTVARRSGEIQAKAGIKMAENTLGSRSFINDLGTVVALSALSNNKD